MIACRTLLHELFAKLHDVIGPFVLGESGRAIAEGKKSVVGVFDVGLSLGIIIS